MLVVHQLWLVLRRLIRHQCWTVVLVIECDVGLLLVPTASLFVCLSQNWLGLLDGVDDLFDLVWVRHYENGRLNLVHKTLCAKMSRRHLSDALLARRHPASMSLLHDAVGRSSIDCLVEPGVLAPCWRW